VAVDAGRERRRGGPRRGRDALHGDAEASVAVVHEHVPGRVTHEQVRDPEQDRAGDEEHAAEEQRQPQPHRARQVQAAAGAGEPQRARPHGSIR
jgi:hypothetical protein